MLLSNLEPLLAELYVLKVDTVETATTGMLTFVPSSMTGYRARLVPETRPQDDAAPITWHIPDCAPILKVGRATFVFPRNIKQHVYYIVSFSSLTDTQLRRVYVALDDGCSIFSTTEEDLTADEWAYHLGILANSAQYNSRFARGISNASVHLANNLTSWKQQLLARMSTQQQAAKSNMVSEHIPVEAEAKEMAQDIATVSSVALQTVEGTLNLLTTPIKHGVRLGIQQGKSAIQSYKASQQKQNPATWGPPPPPNATQEIFGALKSALGTVVGAAVQSGKAVASQGTDVLQDVVAHRYGPEVASVSNEGVRAIVTVVQTVAAVKTFGAANMARHTVEETAKGLVQDEMQWGKGVGYAPRVLVRLTCIPPEADGEDNTHADKDITHDDKDNNNNKSRHALVHVELSLDARIVAVKLGLTKPLIAQPLLGLHHGGGGGAAVHHVPRVKVTITPLRAWSPHDPGYTPPPPRRGASFTNMLRAWKREVAGELADILPNKLPDALPDKLPDVGEKQGGERDASASSTRSAANASSTRMTQRALPTTPASGSGGQQVTVESTGQVMHTTNPLQQQQKHTSRPPRRRSASAMDDCDAWLHDALNALSA